MRSTLSRSKRLSTAGVVWAVVFAAGHLYWALGGDAAIGEPPESLAASLYVGAIALIGLVAAWVAYRLSPRNAATQARLPRRAARAGGALLLAGVAFGTARWVAEGSLGGDGVGGIVITAYFLLGGLLFVALGWASPVRAVEAR